MSIAGRDSVDYTHPIPDDPMTRLRISFVVASLAAASLLPAQTRMLRSPSVSAKHIAFAYAQNIWVVERAGGAARRLTSFQGETQNPKLSPDGALVAFSAEYGGNTDIYVVAVEGGTPKRLTWNPAPDAVQGWTPDGKAVLFSSTRETFGPGAAPKFYTVPVEGGPETYLNINRGYQGRISPDGKRIAYRMNTVDVKVVVAPDDPRRCGPAPYSGPIARPAPRAPSPPAPPA